MLHGNDTTNIHISYFELFEIDSLLSILLSTVFKTWGKLFIINKTE